MVARRWLLHPPLYGLYFVLTLAASNTTDLKGWTDLVWPLSISLLACGVFLARRPMPGPGTRTKPRCSERALVRGILHLRLPGGQPAGRARVLWLIGQEPGTGGPVPPRAPRTVAGSFAARAAGWDPLNQYAMIVGLCLVAYTVVRLYYGPAAASRSSGAPAAAGGLKRGSTATHPDIYLIVARQVHRQRAARSPLRVRQQRRSRSS